MRDKRLHWMFVFLLAAAFLTSGCALLKLPLALIKIPIALAKQAIKIAQKMPKPPPGVLGPF